MSELFGLLEEHPESVIACVALLTLLVSFVSILLTVAALYIQRQHNYKSVMPIASIHETDVSEHVAVVLRNIGVGPMIIKSLRVTDGSTTTNDIRTWVRHLPGTNSWYDLEGDCIAAGSEIPLTRMTGDPTDPQLRKR